MRMTIFIVALSTLSDNTAKAVISETALLLQLASNTTATVTHTLDILNVARETGEKIDHYHTLAVRRWYAARRLEQHIRDMADIARMRPKNLREINRELSRLKTNLRGLKDVIDELAMDIWRVEDYTARYWDKITNSKVDEAEINAQELLSSGGGPSKRHVQNTAINTAMNGKILNKIRRDGLEYQKIDLGMKRTAASRELRRRQFYREWLR